ncbi:GntR family transcriptional regulator [Nonomuraea monospora]|uniref:GntR family transcriptional regulator n=1 Tax=Nonomuraea monospora TaxID=568818 RepID=UPI0031E15876
MEPDRNSQTRQSQAYEGLRSLLLSGGMPPGTRLTEVELTSRFNVSRSTMRAVLVRLTQEGYVTSEVNRGVRTRSFSAAEAADILEAREVLESALAGKAAERATEEEIGELRGTLAAMEGCKRLGDQAGYSQANRRFHQQVKEAAHQEILARAYDTLLYPLVMRQYRNLSAQHPRSGSLEEHQAILLAIVTRNPDAAVAAMRHHVASARRALLLQTIADNAAAATASGQAGALDRAAPSGQDTPPGQDAGLAEPPAPVAPAVTHAAD